MSKYALSFKEVFLCKVYKIKYLETYYITAGFKYQDDIWKEGRSRLQQEVYKVKYIILDLIVRHFKGAGLTIRFRMDESSWSIEKDYVD